MLEVVHIAEAEARELPWRNGRGVTRELARWPLADERAPDFLWRVSSARVEHAGEFSSFPGVERVLVVTAGPGIVLAHGAAAPRARLRRLEPYRFPGDWPTTAELPGGPVVDFNVMVRAGEVAADVQVLALGRRRARESLSAGHAFVHLVAGECVARITGEEEPFELEAGESLWARGLSGGEELEIVGVEAPCEVLLVALAGA